MISRMFGAPLGGTTRGGHQVFDPLRVSPITPPNFASGAGIWLPFIVVVALGVPSTPVTSCAVAGVTDSMAARRTAAAAVVTRTAFSFRFILYLPVPILI